MTRSALLRRGYGGDGFASGMYVIASAIGWVYGSETQLRQKTLVTVGKEPLLKPCYRILVSLDECFNLSNGLKDVAPQST